MSTQLKTIGLPAQPIPARQPLPDLLHDSISAHVESRSNAALEADGIALSFLELDRRAGKIANLLISQGIQSGNIVAIRQDWSADLFACLLGVLKAGAAYVTIDPNADVADAAAIAKRCGAKLLIDSARLPAMTTPVPAAVVIMEDAQEGLDRLSGQVSFAGRRRPIAERTSSVICTARDSGVASIKHRDAVRFARSLAKLYHLHGDLRCYHDASIAFEVAVEEGLAMLAVGATLVLDRPAAGSSEALVEFIAARGITLLSASPEIMAGIDEELPSLEVLLLGRTISASDLVVRWAFRVSCVVSLKCADDRFPTFRIEQERRGPTKPGLIFGHVADRHTRL